MKPSPSALLLWLIALLLLLLAWVTVTGRLGASRHGYASLDRRQPHPCAHRGFSKGIVVAARPG